MAISEPEPTVVQVSNAGPVNAGPVQVSNAGPVHAAAEEPAAKKLCRTSSEVSDDDDGDGMSFNQGACAVEPAPRRNLETEEGKLMLLADNTQQGMLDLLTSSLP